MVKCTGRGLVVKRPGVLSKVQMLNLVLGVGVFPLLPSFCWHFAAFPHKNQGTQLEGFMEGSSVNKLWFKIPSQAEVKVRVERCGAPKGASPSARP